VPHLRNTKPTRSCTVDLGQLKRKQATFTVEFDNEKLRIQYNPHQYDDECQRVLHDLTNKPDNSSMGTIFSRLFTGWDLKDDGNDVPCTEEAYNTLPSFLRTAILNALIQDEMELGKLNSSDSTSNRRERSGLVPIGTPSGLTSNGQD
jgi:hypothetical protein